MYMHSRLQNLVQRGISLQHQTPGRQLQGIHKHAWQPAPAAPTSNPAAMWRNRHHRTVPAAAASGSDPHAVLQVPRGSSRRQIRAAYIERIKQLHPDVAAASGQEDTTRQAAALNAAYEQLMAGFASNSRSDSDEEGDEFDPLEVFDFPEAEPDRLFVNPFACYNISPLQWEELQAVARDAAATGRDPWYALQQQGVQCSEGAFIYLSPRQLVIVGEELERACASLDPVSMEAAAFFLSECLLRARVGNNRVPARATA